MGIHTGILVNSTTHLKENLVGMPSNSNFTRLTIKFVDKTSTCQNLSRKITLSEESSIDHPFNFAAAVALPTPLESEFLTQTIVARCS